MREPNGGFVRAPCIHTQKSKMRTTTITALLLLLCAASALAHSISVPMAHVQRRDPWWQQTKKRDVIAGLDNLRPPDVWTVNVTVGSPPQVFPVNIDTGTPRIQFWHLCYVWQCGLYATV